MAFKHVLGAASLGAALIAAQPAPGASLTYDCQARMTRAEIVPPIAAGDSDPWQCRTPTAKTSRATHWQRNALEYCRLALGQYDQALAAARRVVRRSRARQRIGVMDGD